MEEKHYINLCFKEISKNLNWKDYTTWTSSDYKILSKLISEKTKIAISPQTLKRLSGKLSYNTRYNPQTASKNALAMFIGYKDWNEFLLANKPGSQEIITSTQIKKAKKKRPIFFIFSIIILVGIASTIVYQVKLASNKEFSFSVEDPIGTIPHNVMVLYDVSKLKTDKITVDFEFNHPILGSQEVTIDKTKNLLNFTYQVPGIYNIHLKSKGKILDSKKVIVLTEDWISYFIPETDMDHLWIDNIIKNTDDKNKLDITRESLEKQGFKTNQIFDIMHRIMKDLNIDGDNFRFMIKYKNSISTGGITCYDTEVRLHCTNFINLICLTEKDCQQFSKIKFGEIDLKGNVNDLSEVTVNPNIVNELVIENRNKIVQVFLNGNPIYDLEYMESNGNIMGIDCVFKGCGIIESILLEDLDGNNRYSENFKQN